MNWSISATPERLSLGVCQDKLLRILRRVHCSKVIVTLHQTGCWEESFVLLCEVPLPEVTIKTHLSAQANVFIPDSRLEVFTCSFVVSQPSLKSKVFLKTTCPDPDKVFHSELTFYNCNIIQGRALLPLSLTSLLF